MIEDKYGNRSALGDARQTLNELEGRIEGAPDAVGGAIGRELDLEVAEGESIIRGLTRQGEDIRAVLRCGTTDASGRTKWREENKLKAEERVRRGEGSSL